MTQKYKRSSTGGFIVLLSVLMSAIALESGYTGNKDWYMVLLVTLPLLFLALRNIRQRNDAVLRIRPGQKAKGERRKVKGEKELFTEDLTPS